MVNGDDRRPDGWAMTVLADICCLRVLRILSGRINAVVAADTVARNVRVVECRRLPGDRCMAVVAVVATRYMCGMFARGRDAIVT